MEATADPGRSVLRDAHAVVSGFGAWIEVDDGARAGGGVGAVRLRDCMGRARSHDGGWPSSFEGRVFNAAGGGRLLLEEEEEGEEEG
jgi:hypothetical protein